MKRILVTGGAGFIGSNLVSHLLATRSDLSVTVLDALTYAGDPRNFDRHVIDSGRFEFWQGNVRNGPLVDRLVSQADVVVHLAAETHVTRSIYDDVVFFETDVLGTQTVASAVLRHRRRVDRFIHVSTSEVYGTALTRPMTEDHPLNPMSPYAAAKTGADRLVHAYGVTYELPVIIIRPFNNYGPRQHLEKLMPRFITSALCGEPLTVHGEGTQARDWLFVDDHCRALEAAIDGPLEKLRGQIVNVASGRDVAVLDVARRVVEATGADPALIVHTHNRPGQVQCHVGSNDRAAHLLGWRPAVDLDEGIERTIRWYADHRSWWERLLWMKDEPAPLQRR